MKKSGMCFNLALLVLYVVVSVPGITGYAAHEWVGAAIVVAFVAHNAPRLDWVASIVKGGSPRARASLAVDALALLALMACAVSGIMVSGALLPALGLYAEGYYFWDPLHAASAKFLLALVLIHLALHVDVIAALYLRRGSRKEGTDDQTA